MGRTLMAALETWQAVRDAMVIADTSALDALLDDDFTLTHMTGYVQPKAAWLGAIDSGEMEYHQITDVESLQAGEASGGELLTVRTMTDATIWGGRGDWRLQLRLRFAPEQSEGHDETLVLEMVASVW
jgi:hypothetical protein